MLALFPVWPVASLVLVGAAPAAMLGGPTPTNPLSDA